jgi:hypothetical protein
MAKTCENLPDLAIVSADVSRSATRTNGNGVCESLRRRRAIRWPLIHGQTAALQQIELNRSVSKRRWTSMSARMIFRTAVGNPSIWELRNAGD